MRIAVTTDDGVHVAAHTGRCRSFVIFDVLDGAPVRREERANTFTPHAQGRCKQGHEDAAKHAAGSGHHSHGALLEAIGDCDVLVSHGMGRRLLDDLAARGIEPCACDVDGVDEAAALLAAGKLPRLPGGGHCRHGAP